MKKFSIGYRTIKTAVGAAIAIAVAQFFDLHFYTAAGILTILSVQPTKKKSLKAVYTRVVASIIGMALAYLFFGIFGYNPVILGIMILFFIPIIVSLRVSEGFVSSVVIIMHIYSQAHFTLDLLYNELALMVIGYSAGLIVNIYMPDIQAELNWYRKEVESLYAKIFSEIAKYLKEGDMIWDGYELVKAVEIINKAKALAFQEVENHLTRKENLYYVYFDMREQQLEIIERVLPKITDLPVIVQQSNLIAVFMEELSQNVHSGNTASQFRDKLEEVKIEFAKMPLPNDHQTFIAMAALYQFIEEMDAYLAIKQSFKGMK